MSKSDASEYSRCINLSDDAEQIAHKIGKAEDSTPSCCRARKRDWQGGRPRRRIRRHFAALSGRDKVGVLAEDGGANFSTFKNALARSCWKLTTATIPGLKHTS